MKDESSHTYAAATSIAAAMVVLGMAALTLSLPAAATVQFAKQTGKSCGDCHTSAQGGGPLTPLGEKFKANGDKMPK
jgi:mono/diheme cytochrome c family protein